MDTNNFYTYASIYLIIGLLFIIYYLKNKKKYKDKFGYNGIFFGIILYYIAIPVILFTNINKFMAYEDTRGIYGDNSIYKYIFNNDAQNIIYAIILITIFYIFFNLGYKKSNKKDQHQKVEINNNNLDKIIKFFIYFTFFIGSASLIIFFLAFGGIKQALSMAEYLRSFANETTDVIGNTSLLFITAKFITVTPFLLAYYIEKNKHKKNLPYYIMLYLISVGLSILYFLFYAGRFPIVCFLLALLYIFIRKVSKRPWLIIIALGIISLPLLDILDNIFIMLSNGSISNIKVDYIKNLYDFIYPIRSVINVIPLTQKYGMHYFYDIFIGIFDILPGITVKASYIPTSEFFYGFDWKNIGGIPNDIVTFGYYQLGIIGVISLAYAIGFIIQKIDYRLQKTFNDSKYYIGANLTVMCFSLINNADTVSFIKSQFFLIIIFIIFVMSTKKKGKE